MDEDEIEFERIDIKDDPSILSPPHVNSVFACATAVTVTGFVPGAGLELEIASTVLPAVSAGSPEPDGYTFTELTPLQAGDSIRARQSDGSAQSAWSTPYIVQNYQDEYAAGPPRPEINPEPVYECGLRTGVSNLLVGCNTWITADTVEVGLVKGAKEHQGINVSPAYALNQRVRAFAEMCGDLSPPSTQFIAAPPPNPLPEPSIDDAYEGGERIRIKNLVNGATFRIERGSQNFGPYRTWGHAHLVTLTPPLIDGEDIAVYQKMCDSQPESDPGKTEVQPCSSLPSPRVHPIQAGDTEIMLLEWVVGARIKVFQNAEKIGDGGPATITLTRAITRDQPVYVQQVIGSCLGQTVRVVNPRCVSPGTHGDPSHRNLFPVGTQDFSVGPFKGSVFYPAEDDGDGQPFNVRWSGVQQSPIVVMAHGNHATHHRPGDRSNETCVPESGWPEIPNHKGYRYLQSQLASMGIVAVSVDCNATNCVGNTVLNIEQRADLILGTLDHFSNLNAGGDAIFGGKIDFENVGLLGHSRGGEAVVIAGNQASAALGVRVRAVISLAPVNHDRFVPEDYAFMTILPASDGDVQDNGGAKFYDLAKPEPFKSQIYIDRANHNYFNREWINDEDGRSPPAVLQRNQHERILSRYGCAFLRSFLFGQDLTDYLTYRTHPAGVAVEHVHLSFEWEDQIMVDDHEQSNGIARNTFDQPTSQSSGMNAEEFDLVRFGASPAPGNSFWGQTVGMIASGRSGSVFRTQLDRSYDLTDTEEKQIEIWIRVAEVSNGGNNPAQGVQFELGIENSSGQLAWAASDEVGGVPRPFDDPPGSTKSMLSTLRFPLRCFISEKGELESLDTVAILIRLNQDQEREIAFDVLQIVTLA